MSNQFPIVNYFYSRHLWNDQMVKNAVLKKWITQKECDKILSGGKK